MAYLDHGTAFAAAGFDSVPAPWTRQAEDTAEFSGLEWSVIVLARRDSIASLSTPGPLARALGGLFGLGRKSMLADPRLEALRRIAVYSWRRGYTLPVSEIKRFLAAGFTSGQIEILLANISNRRSAPRRRGVA